MSVYRFEELQRLATTDRALCGIARPGRCGRSVTPKERWEKDTCHRDEGHKGKHRGWRWPACSICGQEMKCRNATYTCEHPGVDRAEFALGAMGDAHTIRTLIACVLAQASGQETPESGMYSTAERIVGTIRESGLVEGLTA